MYRNIESLFYIPGTNTGLYVHYTSKTNSEKEIRFVVLRGRSCGEGELDEGSEEEQTSSYK